MLRNLAFITVPLTTLVLLSGCNNAGTPAASNVFAGNWDTTFTLELPNGTSNPFPTLPISVASDGKITSSASDALSVQGSLLNDGTTNLSIIALSGGKQASVVLTGKLSLSGATASGKLSATVTSTTGMTATVPANVSLTRR